MEGMFGGFQTARERCLLPDQEAESGRRAWPGADLIGITRTPIVLSPGHTQDLGEALYLQALVCTRLSDPLSIHLHSSTRLL